MAATRWYTHVCDDVDGAEHRRHDGGGGEAQAQKAASWAEATLASWRCAETREVPLFSHELGLKDNPSQLREEKQDTVRV